MTPAERMAIYNKAEITLAKVSILMAEMDRAFLENKERRNQVDALMLTINPTGKCLKCEQVIVKASVITCDLCQLENEVNKTA